MVCGRGYGYSARKIYQSRIIGGGLSQAITMKRTKNENDGMNKMIQANKDEAESMLRVWGKKRRPHIQPNNTRPK